MAEETGFRRMRAKLGAPKAMTATAHKLARILYHRLTTRQPYAETRLAAADEAHRHRTESRLRAQARVLGYALVPVHKAGQFLRSPHPASAAGAMTEETGFRRVRLSGTLRAAGPAEASNTPASPLVLNGVSPFRSMVPGRVRKSLVTPQTVRATGWWRSRLERVPAVLARPGPPAGHGRHPHPGGAAMPRRGRAAPPAPSPRRSCTRTRRASTSAPPSSTSACPSTGTRSPSGASGPSPRICTPWPTGSQQCGVTTVAMESTGVYWIPLYQILETRGVEVCLVNARHVKNVPGRKTDVQDCQWLQYLHSVGLLRGSFRPPETVCAVRSLLRHRDTLVQLAATHTQHMQKALTQMNLQLHHVLSDITGVTGLAILDAILAGERDPAGAGRPPGPPRSRPPRRPSPRPSWGTTGRSISSRCASPWTSYRQYQRLIGECDREVQTPARGVRLHDRSRPAPAPSGSRLPSQGARHPQHPRASTSGPSSTGSSAPTSRRCPASRPPRSIRSSRSWAPTCPRSPPAATSPRGSASAPTTASRAARSSPSRPAT